MEGQFRFSVFNTLGKAVCWSRNPFFPSYAKWAGLKVALASLPNWFTCGKVESLRWYWLSMRSHSSFGGFFEFSGWQADLTRRSNGARPVTTWMFFSFGAWFMITKLSEVQTSLRKVKVDRWWSRKRKRQKRTRARSLLRPYTHITRLLRYLENEQQEHAWPQSGYETRNLLQLKLSIPTKNTTEALGQRMDSHRAFEQSISYNSSFFNTPHITYIIILNLSSHINYHGATL